MNLYVWLSFFFPPARTRVFFLKKRSLRTVFSSSIWLCLNGARARLYIQTNHLSLYIQSLPSWKSGSFPVSDVGALGVIGRGHRRRVAPALFGVVEAIVVLVRGRGGFRGAAGEHGAAHQGEDGAHPSGVEGEAERHEALLLVGADGEPHGGNQTTQSWGGKRQVVNDGYMLLCINLLLICCDTKTQYETSKSKISVEEIKLGMPPIKIILMLVFDEENGL